jgi:hypothetical protein
MTTHGLGGPGRVRRLRPAATPNIDRLQSVIKWGAALGVHY